MIAIISMILGAILGTYTAHRRGGDRLDKLQYGAVYTIIFGILGLFATLIIEKML